MDIALNNFLSELDERADDPEFKRPNPRKTRVAGLAKDCCPPKGITPWMISKRWTSGTNVAFKTRIFK